MAVDRERREAIVKAIRESSLHALACFSPTEVLLLTGYWPVMASSVAVVTRDGDAVCIVPEDELELAKSTSDAQFISYAPHSLDELTEVPEALLGPVSELAARVHRQAGRASGSASRDVGTDLRDGMQTAAYQASNHFRASVAPLLRHAFPDASVVSADAMLTQLKSLKTTVELDLMRRASRLAATGFEAAERVIAAGRREDEVAAEIEAAFARVANEGFERGRGYFFCMSGPNSVKAAGAYARTRRRVLEAGDLVMIHANTTGDGYWTDITRTYVVGKPSEQQARMQEAITEARDAALSAIRPGAKASHVDAAARSVIAKHGFGKEFKHATGHGVGFAATDPDALPRIHPLSPDVLEAGMVFNIEPAIYLEGVGGMRHCDVVACTGSGAEVLTSFSQPVGLPLSLQSIS